MSKEVNILSKGKVILYKGKAILSKGKIILPRGKVIFPEGKVVLPKGKIVLPEGIFVIYQLKNADIKLFLGFFDFFSFRNYFIPMKNGGLRSEIYFLITFSHKR